MAAWTQDELVAIANDQNLYMSFPTADGSLHKPTLAWIVQAGDELYARSYNGVSGRWYTAAKTAGHGHISVGGIEKDVTVEFPTDDATNDAVDAGFESKYAGSPYTPPMLGEAQRAATVRFIPVSA